MQIRHWQLQSYKTQGSRATQTNSRHLQLAGKKGNNDGGGDLDFSGADSWRPVRAQCLMGLSHQLNAFWLRLQPSDVKMLVEPVIVPSSKSVLVDPVAIAVRCESRWPITSREPDECDESRLYQPAPSPESPTNNKPQISFHPPGAILYQSATHQESTPRRPISLRLPGRRSPTSAIVAPILESRGENEQQHLRSIAIFIFIFIFIFRHAQSTWRHGDYPLLATTKFRPFLFQGLNMPPHVRLNTQAARSALPCAFSVHVPPLSSSPGRLVLI